jgi:hypothetical protein
MLAFPPSSATLLPCTVLLPAALTHPPALLLPRGCLLPRTARLLLWLRLPGTLRLLLLRLSLRLHLTVLAPLLSGSGGALALLLLLLLPFSRLRPLRLLMGALLSTGGRRDLLLSLRSAIPLPTLLSSALKPFRPGSSSLWLILLRVRKRNRTDAQKQRGSASS